MPEKRAAVCLKAGNRRLRKSARRLRKKRLFWGETLGHLGEFF